MDSWPQDDRDFQIPSNETDKNKKGGGRKGSNKRTDYLTNAYPNLKQGMAGAATLVKQPGGNKLEWSFLQDYNKPGKPIGLDREMLLTGLSDKEWKLAGSSVAKVFPNTRCAPFPKSQHTAKQKSEQGVRFICSSPLSNSNSRIGQFPPDSSPRHRDSL